MFSVFKMQNFFYRAQYYLCSSRLRYVNIHSKVQSIPEWESSFISTGGIRLHESKARVRNFSEFFFIQRLLKPENR